MREKPTYEELEKRVQELEAAESEWKRTEAALRESQASYQAIFEQAAVGIGSAGPGGKILDVNKALCDMLGYSREELLRATLSEITWPEDVAVENELIQEVIEGKRDAFHLEKRLLHKNGHPIWVHHSSNVVRLGKEEEPFAIGVSVDITARKEAEGALKKTRAFLDQTGRMARVGGWEVNADTREVNWTEETFRIHEIPREAEPPLEEAIRFFHSEDRPMLRAAIECGLRHGIPYDLELRFVTAKGNELWVRTMARPILEGERVSRLVGTFQDITDRKAIEEAFKRSEERLRTVLESMGDGIFVHDLEGRFLLLNEAACRQTGYSRSELLRKTVADIDPNSPFQDRFKDFWANPPRDELLQFESEHRGRDGFVYPVEINLTRISMPGGPAILALARDIAQRKQAEQALREREALHRIISELSTDYFYRVKIEASGTISIDWVSESFERVTTYAPDELDQLETWMTKVHPDDLEKLEKNAELLLANRPVGSHYRFTTRTGETRWFADRLHPEWSAAENRVVGAYGAVRDITERKKSEEALRESEARLRAIFEQAAAGIATATAEGIFLETNRTLCDMLGYTAEELRGLSVYDITFPDDREKQLEEDEPVREGKSDTVRMEKRFLHKAGHPVWANLASNVIRDQAGNIQYVIGVVVDIDQRKRMEEALLESLEEKEVLLREIHHRVKNNMQAIVSLLRMHSRMGGDVPFKTIFEDCRGRIEAMALIHEALYQSDDLIRIDFQAYLRKLCRNLGRVHGAVEKGISVAVAPTRISLDMDQGIAVGMVIAELVSNAFKHAFPSGRIGNVTIGMETPEPGTVELRVADDGIGLPPDFDLENPQKLGLRLVSAAVLRELGGALEFNRNGGAAFVVRFPFANR